MNFTNFEVAIGDNMQYGEYTGGALHVDMNDPDSTLSLTSCIFTSIILKSGYGAGIGISTNYVSAIPFDTALI